MTTPRPNELLQAILERIGTTARTEAVFGEPRELDGATVIPVARVTYGFGAGGGWRAAESSEGEGGGGGGGGVHVHPLGYLVSEAGEVKFRHIEDWRRTAAYVGAGILVGLFLASRVLRR